MRGDDDVARAAGLPFAAPTSTGLRLAVRLTPRAARSGLDGFAPGADGRPALRLRVAAPPVEGAANAALIDLLAGSLRMRKSDVAIVGGARGRSKLLELRGDPADLLARLAAWMEAERRRS
jgi:uncharacterized protein